jgi:hypothetical protein
MSETTVSEVPVFVPEQYYTGICDEVRVAQLGDSQMLELGFTIGDFRSYTGSFLGSSKIGKDGKTNDDRIKEDLMLFGCEAQGLETGPVMNYIRSKVIGKEIEFKAEVYKTEIQFRGFRPPGMKRGPKIVLTENPFGVSGTKPAAGGGVF